MVQPAAMESNDPRAHCLPDVHGHAKGEHRPYAAERPMAYSARMLLLWFYHACRRGGPKFLMLSDHSNLLSPHDPIAVATARFALQRVQAGDIEGAAALAEMDIAQMSTIAEGLARGMIFAIGAEVDNDPRNLSDAPEILDAMQPDGLIRSVHFIPIDHVEGGVFAWPFDNPEFVSYYDRITPEQLWERYMAILLHDVKHLPGQIVGHFYVPALFGDWPSDALLQQYEDEIIAACASNGMALEINARALYCDHTPEQKHAYLQANRRLICKAVAKGVGLALGSDAHAPRDQGSAFDRLRELLVEADVEHLMFPIRGELVAIPLSGPA